MMGMIGGGGCDVTPLAIIQIPSLKLLDNGQQTVRKCWFLEKCFNILFDFKTSFFPKAF